MLGATCTPARVRCVQGGWAGCPGRPGDGSAERGGPGNIWTRAEQKAGQMGQSFKVWEGGEQGGCQAQRKKRATGSWRGRWAKTAVQQGGGWWRVRGSTSQRGAGAADLGGDCGLGCILVEFRLGQLFWVFVFSFVKCPTFRVLVKIKYCNRDKHLPCCLCIDGHL